MKLRHRFLFCAAALSAVLLFIVGAAWKDPRRGAAVLAAPVISGLDPSAITAGSPGFTLTLNGGFFESGCVVHWNGGERATTVVNSGVLRAQIPASDVASEGTAGVTVVNPIVPNGHSGASNTLAFRILPATSF